MTNVTNRLKVSIIGQKITQYSQNGAINISADSASSVTELINERFMSLLNDYKNSHLQIVGEPSEKLDRESVLGRKRQQVANLTRLIPVAQTMITELGKAKESGHDVELIDDQKLTIKNTVRELYNVAQDSEDSRSAGFFGKKVRGETEVAKISHEVAQTLMFFLRCRAPSVFNDLLQEIQGTAAIPAGTKDISTVVERTLDADITVMHTRIREIERLTVTPPQSTPSLGGGGGS